MMGQPDGMTEEHFEFLDELRKSGETNMWGAAPYLRDWFGLGKKDAADYLLYWIETFEQRHKKDD